MKTTLRIFSLFLALLMCMGVFAACGNDDTDEQTQDTAEVGSDDNEWDNLEPQDFSSKEFRVLDANDHPEMHINYSESLEGSEVSQVLYEKDLYIEEKNKVNIVYEQVNNCNLNGISSFTTAYSAGDRVHDLVVSTASGDRLAPLSCQGFFVNLESLPTLDLAQKWWSAQMNESMRLGGKMYFTTGDIMASVYDAPMAVYANKKLVSEYKIADDLYQKVKEGDWTVDYMIQITKDLSSDLDGDGVMHADNDFFSVVGQPIRMTAVGLLIGMGYDMSYIMDDTSVVINNDFETLTNFCAKIRSFVVTPQREKNNDVIDKTFKSDRALFLIHLMEAANHNLRDMSSDYMVLPMPKYDSYQENYRSYINGWVDCFVAVPAFAEDSDYAQFTGYMLESMAQASYHIVRPVAFDQVVKYQSSRDPETIEMMNIIYDSLYLDFQGIYDFGGLGTIISDHIFNDKELASSWNTSIGTAQNKSQEISSQWLNPGSPTQG